MFCTDIFSHVCGGTNADGSLLDYDGEVIAGLSELSNGNPKLLEDQEKLIAYLIENGHSYSGTGDYYFGGATQAIKDGSSGERAALQTLIWCISDPVDFSRVPPENSGDERDLACEVSMGAGEQQRLLALIPTTPEIQLSFGSPAATATPGSTAQFDLKTNLYNQPITVAATGVSGVLTVLSGNASLSRAVLTVDGTDPDLFATVTLGFTSAEAGQVTIEVEAQPASRQHLGWNQSPGITASDDRPCQVFATHNESRRALVQDSALATFALSGRVLPATGSSPLPVLLLALGLTAVGVVLTSRAGRAPR